jgi:hypothetical protein
MGWGIAALLYSLSVHAPIILVVGALAIGAFFTALLVPALFLFAAGKLIELIDETWRELASLRGGALVFPCIGIGWIFIGMPLLAWHIWGHY